MTTDGERPAPPPAATPSGVGGGLPSGAEGHDSAGHDSAGHDGASRSGDAAGGSGREPAPVGWPSSAARRSHPPYGDVPRRPAETQPVRPPGPAATNQPAQPPPRPVGGPPLPGVTPPGATPRPGVSPTAVPRPAGVRPAGVPVPGAPAATPGRDAVRPATTQPGPAQAAPRPAPGRPAAGRAPGSPVSVGQSPARKGGRRARLTVKRIDPWSTLKFSFVYSLAGLIVLLVAVVALYAIVDAMGVLNSIRSFLHDIEGSKSSGIAAWLGFGRVLTVAAVVGVINVILFTAFATVTAFIYNVCTDLVGGIEVTLAEKG